VRPSSLLPLLAALVLAAALAGPALAQDPAATVEVVDNDFEPAVVAVDVGDTVAWTWRGDNFHDVTFDDGVGSSPTQRAGEHARTFDAAGRYTYFCSIHGRGSMSGAVDVGQDGGTPTEAPTDEPTEEPTDDPGGAPDPAPTTGDDPVAVALAWSALVDAADAVVIGTAAGFADSLASGVLQGHLDAPLLLTPRDGLDARVAAEVERLGATRAVLLGGEAALAPQVEADLAALGVEVLRIGGDDRIETALVVARYVADQGGDLGSVFIARAFGEGSAGFADALGGGAAAAQTGRPVLLTPTESLDPRVAAFLDDQGVSSAGILGGVAAVSADTAAAVAAIVPETFRFEGLTRFATAAAVRQVLTPEADAPATLVEGTGPLAWADGFAAALSARGGVLLSAGPQVPNATLRSVLANGDVVCGATLSGDACATARAAAEVDVTRPVLRAVMDAGQEVPPGDSTGSGIAVLLRGPAGICLDAGAVGLTGPVVDAHVHAAPFGAAGDAVIPFDLMPGDLDPAGLLGCTALGDTAALDALEADPAGHYVNLHTEAHPGGEVRGQVFADGGRQLLADLTGAAEVPGPGDPDAGGIAQVYDTGVPDELCTYLAVFDVDEPVTAAHIHRGAAGEQGPVVIPLRVPLEGGSWSCQRGLDPALLAEVRTSPSAFYVNVHTAAFPMGAVRGQLVPFDAAGN
jgi:plastocyanin